MSFAFLYSAESDNKQLMSGSCKLIRRSQALHKSPRLGKSESNEFNK